MNEYLNEIKPFIQDIVSKTNNGSIPWKRVNPSTLNWVKEVESGRVRTTIQRVEGPHRTFYRFEVKEVKSGEELIAVDTRELDEIQPEIEHLYHTAEHYSYQIQTKRSDILKELLES